MSTMVKKDAAGLVARHVLLLLIAGTNSVVSAMGHRPVVRPRAVNQEDLMHEANFLARRIIADLERSRPLSQEEKVLIAQARLIYAENAVERVQGMTRDQINTTLANGMTPLIDAARQGRVAVVQQLLHQGADASLRDAHGQTAYDYACEDVVARDMGDGGAISPETLVVQGEIRRALMRARGR